MRLTKIKLVGFKTFVDPTTFFVPGNLLGVVGPNGCGKSNIIDAVTWVMGESSAKHLRGENLTDVIFNGSSTRKPVGQASAELVFDNSDGKLGGQYASYNEISIKRQMNREGISTYYLNGSRCRRRDIQGIFLGTGLGPRSYAIIEQGVISRLIEARPEELRTFIEEAAGISKFRERRRETENRIRHTRENIERLDDIREELSKQLGHLKRQARAAERYQVLKKEERQLKMELLALNWQGLDKQFASREEKVREQETKVEEANARLRHIEAEIEKQRDALSGANEALSDAQSVFYQIGGEISHLEQKIQHANERIQSLQSDLSNLHESASSSRMQEENDRSRLEALAGQMASLEPELLGSRSDSSRAYDALNQAEQAMQGWQTEWDACVETASDFNRQLDVDKARLEYLQDDIEEICSRRQTLHQQLEVIDTDELRQGLTGLAVQLEDQELALQQGRTEIEDKQKQCQQLRIQGHSLGERLAVKRSDYQKLEGKIASLDALQQHVAGTDEETVQEWLTQLDLNKAPRLAQQLEVKPEWTLALETVLGYHLQDICVDDIDTIASRLGNLSGASLGLISGTDHGEQKRDHKSFERLADKVTSKISIDRFLEGVYIAADMDSALNLRNQLTGSESVITTDGIWMGRSWLRVNRPVDEQAGVLAREQQIQKFNSESEILNKEISDLETVQNKCNESLTQLEEALQKQQTNIHPSQQILSGLHSRHAETKTRMEQAEERILQFRDELDGIDQQEKEDKEEIDTLQQRVERTQSDKERLDGQRSNLSEIREKHRRTLDAAREQWQKTHEQSHEIALQLESFSSQKASLEQAIQRIQIQLSNFDARENELNSSLESTKAPLAGLEEALAIKLKDRLESEARLTDARKLVQTVDESLRSQDQHRVESEKQVQELREKLEAARMNAQETRVKLQTIFEQFKASGQENVREVLEQFEQLDETASQQAWQEKLETTERKIHRLGPINLAAIDEFNQLSERKEYLDSQNADLTEALTTLENAIKKIERETRTRFQETFDALNKNLQELFPVLFGGGHAYLELTGNDLLETGVTIMARPPGKRNSTIHLLSGGEKALTAVALIFSIFKLNPAPFCILDEVDAPLDDSNVSRFSDLLTEMSKDIQFIFVTHNKITMEIAQQLLGVTMHEAGVSRLVSVDMDEAVEMVASA